MAITGAMVDRAEAIAKSDTGTRVEGTKQRTPMRSRPFKCRVDLGAGSENHDQGTNRRQRSPSMLYSKRVVDSAGEPMDITGAMEVEVFSDRLFGKGNSRKFQVNGDPTPISKKRRVIAYTAQLVAVTSG